MPLRGTHAKLKVRIFLLKAFMDILSQPKDLDSLPYWPCYLCYFSSFLFKVESIFLPFWFTKKSQVVSRAHKWKPRGPKWSPRGPQEVPKRSPRGPQEVHQEVPPRGPQKVLKSNSYSPDILYHTQ
jgi:hypothetical protein